MPFDSPLWIPLAHWSIFSARYNFRLFENSVIVSMNNVFKHFYIKFFSMVECLSHFRVGRRCVSVKGVIGFLQTCRDHNFLVRSIMWTTYSCLGQPAQELVYYLDFIQSSLTLDLICVVYLIFHSHQMPHWFDLWLICCYFHIVGSCFSFQMYRCRIVLLCLTFIPLFVLWPVFQNHGRWSQWLRY